LVKRKATGVTEDVPPLAPMGGATVRLTVIVAVEASLLSVAVTVATYAPAASPDAAAMFIVRLLGIAPAALIVSQLFPDV
jgi:hypothetical protein